jgi:prolyl oligopeptidase
MKLHYPKTRKVEQYDDYFGTIVHDPYRWLEEDSEEVAAWVAEQNAVTEAYLEQIPYREELRKRVTELMNFPRYSSAKKVGDKYYFLYNDGLKEQSILYVQDGFHGEPKVFLDPNSLSPDGSVSLVSYVISNDQRFMTYSVTRSGSDWSDVRVIDLTTGETLPDLVQNAFSPQTWTPHWYNDGFYYSQFGDTRTGDPEVEEGQYSVRYHKLGTSQSEDTIIFSRPDEPELCFALPTSQRDNLQFLVIFDARYTGNKLYLRGRGDQDFVRFHEDPQYEVLEVDEIDGKALLQTNIDAPTYRIVLADPNDTSPNSWRTIIPARAEAVDDIYYAGGKIIVIYSKDAHHVVYQYDAEGLFEHEIALPGIGTVSGFSTRFDDPKMLFEFSGFTIPRTIYEYDVRTKALRMFKRNDVPYSIDQYKTEQVFVESKDGTPIPAFIVSQKNIIFNGEHPAILTGYGGFNLTLTPEFRPPLIAFLEQGGIFVQANLRGGGEYGVEWFASGSRLNKQNSFDDFYAVAKFLCDHGYTTSSRLAISGGSHGGLLVGVTIVQHPEICRVAIPDVGVFDMLRFDKMGGLDFARDYGLPNIEADFRNLMSYSPLHNVKRNDFPSVLIRAATHDDRVHPGHSYKFAARLQDCQSGKNPTLLAVSMQSGHGKGLSLSRAIAKVADDFAFILHEIGHGV